MKIPVNMNLNFYVCADMHIFVDLIKVSIYKNSVGNNQPLKKYKTHF